MKGAKKYFILTFLLIGTSVFSGCASGVDVTEDAQGLAFYLLDDGNYGVKVGTASYLSELTIPATYNGKKVTKVLDYFFGYTDSDKKPWGYTRSLTISEGIENIQEKAFFNASLTEIVIPNSVTTIKNDAFEGCALEYVTAPAMAFGYLSGEKLREAKITGGEEIGAYDFFLYEQLWSITISVSVTKIGESAFQFCEDLHHIYYEGTKEQWNAIEKGEKWNEGIFTTKVECTDGEVAW